MCRSEEAVGRGLETLHATAGWAVTQHVVQEHVPFVPPSHFGTQPPPLNAHDICQHQNMHPVRSAPGMAVFFSGGPCAVSTPFLESLPNMAKPTTLWFMLVE
jgi:hypothetical protein